MVICGMSVGVMLYDRINPAKMLPIDSRLMGLTIRGLFSFMFS